MSKISKTKALALLQSSAGQFVSVTFKTKAGKERKMTGRYQGATAQGYVKFLENKTKNIPGGMKNVNLQTLSCLSIGGQTLKV